MKTIIVLLVLMLSASLVYAGNGDLIVDGNIGVGTTSPTSQVTLNGTFDPSQHLASPNNITHAAPLSQSNITTVDGTTPLNGSTYYYVAGTNNFLSISSLTTDYSKLTALGFQQSVFNYNPYINNAEASTGVTWNYADLGTGNHSFIGGQFIAFHQGTGMASSALGASNTASITPGAYSGRPLVVGQQLLLGHPARRLLLHRLHLRLQQPRTFMGSKPVQRSRDVAPETRPPQLQAPMV